MRMSERKTNYIATIKTITCALWNMTVYDEKYVIRDSFYEHCTARAELMILSWTMGALLLI